MNCDECNEIIKQCCQVGTKDLQDCLIITYMLEIILITYFSKLFVRYHANSIENYREQLIGIFCEVSLKRFATFFEKAESVNTHFGE